MEHRFGEFNCRDSVQQVVADLRGYPVRGLSWRFGPHCMYGLYPNLTARRSRLSASSPKLDQGIFKIQGMSVWKGEFSF